MDSKALGEIFARTLDDGRLSRSEKRALREIFEESGIDGERELTIVKQMYAAAAEKPSHQAPRTLEWLEDVALLLASCRGAAGPREVRSEVRFSPGDGCRTLIEDLIERARQVIDICVFTITDNRITRDLIAAHRRGVRVRVITDDDKQHDLGSDIAELHAADVPVVVDETGHMHHKFAIFDGRRLLNGSYNWTRSAEAENHENVVVTDDPKLVEAFREEFDTLWVKFGGRG